MKNHDWEAFHHHLVFQVLVAHLVSGLFSILPKHILLTILFYVFENFAASGKIECICVVDARSVMPHFLKRA